MADNAKDTTSAAIDWTTFDMPETVVINRERSIVDVPPVIVALAQASWDAKERHQKVFRGNAKAADQFAALMKDAGDHTTPPTSVTVTQDGIIVKYRAGERRGRKPNSPASNGS